MAHKDSCIIIETSRGIHGYGCFFAFHWARHYSMRRQTLASNSLTTNRPKMHFVPVTCLNVLECSLGNVCYYKAHKPTQIRVLTAPLPIQFVLFGRLENYPKLIDIKYIALQEVSEL